MNYNLAHMTIFAFTGRKGGSGKSSLAIAVACELMRRKHRVLLVDADHEQGTSRTFADIASENEYKAPTVVAMGANMYTQLPDVAKDYKHIVIDSPPRHSSIQRAVLMTCDVAVVPTGPNPTEIWAVAETVGLIDEAKKLRPELAAYIVLNKKDARTVLGRQARSSLQEAGLPILKTELSTRIAYAEAPAAGLGVTEYAPTDKASVETKALVSELLKVKVRKSKNA